MTYNASLVVDVRFPECMVSLAVSAWIMEDPQTEPAVRSVAFLTHEWTTEDTRGHLRSNLFDGYFDCGGFSTFPIDPSCATPAGGLALGHDSSLLNPFTL
jgi:hypothetical protein